MAIHVYFTQILLIDWPYKFVLILFTVRRYYLYWWTDLGEIDRCVEKNVIFFRYIRAESILLLISGVMVNVRNINQWVRNNFRRKFPILLNSSIFELFPSIHNNMLFKSNIFFLFSALAFFFSNFSINDTHNIIKSKWKTLYFLLPCAFFFSIVILEKKKLFSLSFAFLVFILATIRVCENLPTNLFHVLITIGVKVNHKWQKCELEKYIYYIFVTVNSQKSYPFCHRAKLVTFIKWMNQRMSLMIESWIELWTDDVKRR